MRRPRAARASTTPSARSTAGSSGSTSTSTGSGGRWHISASSHRWSARAWPPSPRTSPAATGEIVGDDVWVTQRISRGVAREHGGDGRPTLIVESLPIPFAPRAARVSRRRPGRDPEPPPDAALGAEPAGQDDEPAQPDARRAARSVPIDPGAWPILLDEYGNLGEGGGANIFVVHGERVSTPLARYVLPGHHARRGDRARRSRGPRVRGARDRPVRRLRGRRGLRHLHQPVRLPCRQRSTAGRSPAGAFPGPVHRAGSRMPSRAGRPRLRGAVPAPVSLPAPQGVASR